MTFTNPHLFHVSTGTICEIFGNVYVGAHLRVSDGQFRERKKSDAPIVLCTTDL